MVPGVLEMTAIICDVVLAYFYTIDLQVQSSTRHAEFASCSRQKLVEKASRMMCIRDHIP